MSAIIVRNLVRTRKSIHAELDKQGISNDSPIRGVINYYGDFLAIAYGDSGIEGAINFDICRSMTQLEIFQVRSLVKGIGHGKAMLSAVANTVSGLPRENKYEMVVFGTLSTARSWYESTGATFVDWSTMGRWDAEAVAKLRTNLV